MALIVERTVGHAGFSPEEFGGHSLRAGLASPAANHGETIREEIWNDAEITVLILTDNILTTIPPQIGKLQRLRTLDLGHKRLTDLPGEIGNLTELRDFLYLHDNN